MANRNADVNDTAYLIAAIKAAMFHHSQIPDGRGFDTDRRREVIHREIDELLDELRVSQMLEALEQTEPA